MAKFHYKDSPTVTQRAAFKPYLSEDEELILVTGFSAAYIRSKFAIYLLFPGILFGSLGYFMGWVLKWDIKVTLLLSIIMALTAAVLKTLWLFHANRYLLTTRRVIIKQGLFSVKLSTTLLDKITHLEVLQPFIDRMFLHHGDIVINTAGMNKVEIVLRHVDYPIELKNLLERLINREREQYGKQAVSLSAVEGEIVE